MTQATKPTAAQLAVMKNLRAGLPAEHGINGRSAHGGLTRTVASLYRRGWTTRGAHALTIDGNAALDAALGKRTAS